MTRMSADKIRQTIAGLRDQNKSLFATSSFQSHSIPLLHIISTVEPKIPVYFVNTGFLFPETLTFRDQIASSLALVIRELSSTISKSQQVGQDGNLLFTSAPDLCCQINKTQPVEQILPQFDYWINGVRKDQTSVRSKFETYEPTLHNCTRFHPILDWTEADINRYIEEFELPRHPLEPFGYKSVGCQPCTVVSGSRQGRWQGLRKTECGLHLGLGKGANE